MSADKDKPNLFSSSSFPFLLQLYELHTVDMSHNNLSKIERSVFVNLLSLRHMNFRNNSLEKLESSTFGKLVTLLDLDLSYNKLKKVRRGVFVGENSI